ncbi:Cruciform DNA-recognizing protein 1 [Cladobotryum mycophilum]|uniref:Cruciform DNA-recognizing protein 1 n=1 Tax=Cladobotryum mycophilum TaxID=491253 RepID=A0ABR0S5I3_9HYPO
MGSYTFKWEHPAEEVFVTGTFDDWTKSEQLDRVGDIFKKTVQIKDASKKIYYKFVVDNTWTINESSAKEADHEGNVNNFLTPEDMTNEDPVAAVINTVTPESTTALLAAEQPIEKHEGIATPSDVPGGFPETPSELDKPIGINPLPAANGAVNPFKLAPGEPVPEFNAEDLNRHVKLDEASYEKSDALPGIEASDLELPPVSANTVPESSLPIVDAAATHINTVGPTTLALAAEVPLEDKVPEIVKESQEEAGVDPEASAIPEEVHEKALVEEELKEKVPETSHAGAVAAAAVTAAATTGAAIAAAVFAAKDSIVEKAAPVVDEATTAAAETVNQNIPETVKEQLPEPVQEVLAQHDKVEEPAGVSPEVPAEVKESIVESGESPEAAANTTAVEEKKEVEAQLLEEVKPTPAVDEAKVEEVKPEETPAEVKTEEVAPEVPVEVKESIVESGESPEAAANAAAVEEKKEVEAELLEEVKPTPAIDEAKPEETATEEVKTDEAKPEETKEAEPIPEIKVEETKPEEVKPEEVKSEEVKPEETKVEEVVPTPVVAETPAAEVEKTEAPVTEVSNIEVTKTEVPITEAPTTEVSNIEVTKTEVPVAEETKAEVPAAETAAIETAAVETPKAEVPVPESTEVTQVEDPASLAPEAERPRIEIPPAETPKSEKTEVSPTTDAPKSTVPANGTEEKHATSPTDKKKKHRLSAFFNKLKHKLSDK